MGHMVTDRRGVAGVAGRGLERRMTTSRGHRRHGAMTSDIATVLAERGQRYGEFAGHASLTQALKAAMASHPRYDGLTPSMREALEMIQHKVARMLNGDPSYLDNIIDVVGYATLVKDAMEANAKRAAQQPAQKPPRRRTS